MGECSHNCESCEEKCEKADFLAALNANSKIKKVVAVMSGKGGVGKSFATASLARTMQKAGFKCGVLDADVTGPSIPKIFGKNAERATGADGEIFPVESALGIKLMSINFLLENESDPVIWRGPLIAGTIKQFWTDVRWGGLDFLFIDMPPGTGDVPLTVFQSLPVDGIVVVTTPQDLAALIVEKSVNMSKKMNVPLLGLVENMAFLTCPDCGKKIFPFGEGNAEKVASRFGIPVLASLPIDCEIAKKCDAGQVESLEGREFFSAAEALKSF